MAHQKAQQVYCTCTYNDCKVKKIRQSISSEEKRRNLQMIISTWSETGKWTNFSGKLSDFQVMETIIKKAINLTIYKQMWEEEYWRW